ncbi:MAG: hypothetical protein P1U56_16935 [Saprospiraceae bacterium]|nr:hypothetical protein [Saprospiraceae bacterium]
MKNIYYVFISLVFFSCSNLFKEKNQTSSTKIVKVNEGEGYIYFDVHFDTIQIVELSENLSKSKQFDYCTVKLYLSAYKNTNIFKDSLRYDCQEGSILSEEILNKFYKDFKPKMKGDIGLHYEPYNFYLPLQVEIGNGN